MNSGQAALLFSSRFRQRTCLIIITAELQKDSRLGGLLAKNKQTNMGYKDASMRSQISWVGNLQMLLQKHKEPHECLCVTARKVKLISFVVSCDLNLWAHSDMHMWWTWCSINKLALLTCSGFAFKICEASRRCYGADNLLSLHNIVMHPKWTEPWDALRGICGCAIGK